MASNSSLISSGGNHLEHFYEAVSPDAEVLGRTARANSLHRLVAFFNLVTKLEVPVLASNTNISASQDHVFVGASQSYGVTQPLTPLSKESENHVNPTIDTN